ncbi:FAS1-like dehydratase domain-containing protein [Gordonia sp. NPDC003376]
MRSQPSTSSDDPRCVRRMSKDHHTVGREEVRTFARVVHDWNPLHHREAAAHAAGHRALQAPLTYAAAIAGPMEQADLLADLPGGYDLSQLLHVEERHIYHRPVYVGDRLWRVSWVESYRPSERADVIVIENQFVRADGEVVQSMWTSLLGRSGGAVDPDIVRAAHQVMAVVPDMPETVRIGPDPDALREPGDFRPPGPATTCADQWERGMFLPEHTFEISRTDLVLYSGVSADPNPVHFSEHLARLAGLETVVAQAMLTMALGGAYLGTLVGDPASVREYRARFTSPVYLRATERATLRFGAKVRHRDPESGRAELSITATHDGRRIFGRCSATVDLR